MGLVTNFDLFEEFFHFIKNGATMEEVLEEYGGSDFYIPSYKTTFRNEEICKAYKERLGEKNLIYKLAKENSLSKSQIYEITKHLR